MINNHLSKSRETTTKTYAQNRYNKDFVDAIHFNNNGKKGCNIIVMAPKHTTVIADVTCRNCIHNLEKK